MIIDLELPEEVDAAVELITSIGRQLDTIAPLVFPANLGVWECRLAAVRAGAVGFLVKPLDMQELVDMLDRIIPREQYEPNRVLVVDDAVDLAQYYALVLRQAGMQCETLSDPSEILEKWRVSNPNWCLWISIYPG